MNRPMASWEAHQQMHRDAGHRILTGAYKGNTIHITVTLHDGSEIMYHTPLTFDVEKHSMFRDIMRNKA